MKIHTIQFERSKGKPLYIQLSEKIQNDIIDGYLKKGDQLPSIRKCESKLHISKTVVERAYECLLDGGFIISKAQIGFFVDVDANSASLRRQITRTMMTSSAYVPRFDFRAQSMDSDAFDITLWKKYLKSVLDTHEEIATYGDSQGEYHLRLALQKYAYGIRGVLCHANQIVVGSSFQSLLYIACGLFHKPVVIGMEARGFAQAETVFQDFAYPIVMLAGDEQGIVMEELYKSDVNVLYVNSGSLGTKYQPLGRDRCRALLEWAQQKQGLILEDDHNGELRYVSKSIPAMQGSDIAKRVIYIGSFSKILLPSLRISYMVLPDDLQERFLVRKACYAPTASKIEQLALAHYITDGHLQRHVKRLRKRYEQKSRFLYPLLKANFSGVEIMLEEAGLQYILRFPSMTHLDTFVALALQHDIMISRKQDCEIALSFAAMDEDDMYEAIMLLRQLWTDAYTVQLKTVSG